MMGKALLSPVKKLFYPQGKGFFIPSDEDFPSPVKRFFHLNEKRCLSSPEMFRARNTIHRLYYLHRVEEHLPSIWLYCDVGPSPVYTPLSVSIVSMHATFMTFIIHTYLHHLCILAFFNDCLKSLAQDISIPKKKKRKKKKKEAVWAGHLSSRLSPISRNNIFLLQFPTEIIPRGRRLLWFLLSKQSRKSPFEFIPHGYKVLFDCLFPIHSWIELCLYQRFKFRFLK